MSAEPDTLPPIKGAEPPEEKKEEKTDEAPAVPDDEKKEDDNSVEPVPPPSGAPKAKSAPNTAARPLGGAIHVPSSSPLSPPTPSTRRCKSEATFTKADEEDVNNTLKKCGSDNDLENNPPQRSDDVAAPKEGAETEKKEGEPAEQANTSSENDDVLVAMQEKLKQAMTEKQAASDILATKQEAIFIDDLDPVFDGRYEYNGERNGKPIYQCDDAVICYYDRWTLCHRGKQVFHRDDNYCWYRLVKFSMTSL